MATKDTITINGRQYDAKTGLPVASKPAPRPAAAAAEPAAQPAKKAPAPIKKTAPARTPVTERGTKAATSVHTSEPKRSQTLRRTAVKKPIAPTKVVTRRPKPAGARHMDIARSTQVARFAPHPQAVAAKAATPTDAAKKTVDAPAKTHPVAKRALAKRPVQKMKKAAAAKATTPTAKQVKEAQIQKALSASPAPQTKKQAKSTKKTVKKNTPSTPWKKRTIILTTVAVIALLAVFAATNIFPGLSVQVASIRSGVTASYPKYVPDGYSLSQPIKYSDGRVAITFTSNSNDTKYMLTQSSSSWDSTAVLDNLVKKKADNNYVTTRERGLTIYTYQSNAAWVNGGTLFTIEGDAELSGDQIRKIATSL